MKNEKVEIMTVLRALWAIGISGEQAESAGRIAFVLRDQERERCAKIAEDAVVSHDVAGVVAMSIAEKIRSGL